MAWPGRPTSGWSPGRRAVFGGTTVVPENLPPLLNAQEPPPPMLSIQVLDRIVIEDQTLYIRWVPINVTLAGTTTVIQGVGGKKLTVISIEFVVSAAVAIAWLSAAATVRAAQSFAANSGIARDIVRPYYVQTGAGEALGINLGGVATVVGALGYVEVGT